MKVRTSAFRRLAILSLSALAFAACDDKDTPTVIPTPRVVEVSITPASATLTVGQTATFVANVSNDTTGALSGVTFSSTNTAVATVSASGVVTAVAPGTATIIAASRLQPSKQAAAQVIVNAAPVPVVTITLVPSSATLPAGGTVNLVSVVTGTTNTAVTYTSSDPSVATVNATTGVVTAGANGGTAVITATSVADPTKRATSVITVTPPAPVTISVSPTAATLVQGSTQQLTPTLTGSASQIAAGVSYTSSNAAVATVSAAGVVTAVAPGVTTITVRSNADNTKVATSTITVTAPPARPPVSVTITPSSAAMTVGQQVTFLADVANDTTGANSGVTFSSSSPAIVTVDPVTGVATAVAAGSASIIATSKFDPTKRATAGVTVTANPFPPVTISLSPSASTISIGGTQQMTATVSGGNNAAAEGARFTSSAPSVATIDSITGLVTGVSAGTTTITARSVQGGVVSTATVTVTAAPPVGITVTPSNIQNLAVGSSQQIVANVTGSSDQTVVCTSADPSVATVASTADNTGCVVTGTGAGNTVISVRPNADPTKVATVQIGAVGASVAIATVATTNGSPVTAATGTVNVTANVSVPAGTADSLQIRLTNTTTGAVINITCQRFTSAGAATQVICPVNPADYDPTTAGAQVLPNGTYQVAAVLLRNNQQAAIATFGQQLTTANPNTFAVSISTVGVSEPDGQEIGADATLWNEGNVVVTATPSMFTGDVVNGATLCVNIPGGGTAAPGSATGVSCKAGTLSGGVFTATFNKSQAVGGATNGVANVSNSQVHASVTASTTTSGAVGPTAPSGPTSPSLQLDNLRPAPAPTVALQNVQNNFVNGSYQFNQANVVTGASTDPLPGVGLVSYAFFAAANTATNQGRTDSAFVANAQQVTSGADLAATTTNTAYILVVVAQDTLGNRAFSRLAAPFGVDTGTPTFTIVAGSPADSTINPDDQFSFTFTDDVSGFSATPVEVRIVRYTSPSAATPTRCVDVNTQAATAVPAAGCAFVTLTTATFPVPAADGYYVITMRVRDRAGNLSTEVTRTFLRDVTAPVATITSFGVAGNDVTVNATLTDNVELRGYDWRMRFGAAAAPTGAASNELPVSPVTADQMGLFELGTFGPGTMDGSEAVSSPTITSWRSLTVFTGPGVSTTTNTDGVGVGAFDIALNFNSAFVNVAQAGGTLPTGLSNFTLTSANATLCNGITPLPSGDNGVACAANRPTSTTLTAEATGPTGTFENPFPGGVNFYAVYPNGSVRLLGNTTSFTTLEQQSPTVNRLYRYSFTFNASRRPQGTYNVFAVGINGRDGFRSPTAPIVIEGAAQQPER